MPLEINRVVGTVGQHFFIDDTDNSIRYEVSYEISSGGSEIPIGTRLIASVRPLTGPLRGQEWHYTNRILWSRFDPDNPNFGIVGTFTNLALDLLDTYLDEFRVSWDGTRPSRFEREEVI